MTGLAFGTVAALMIIFTPMAADAAIIEVVFKIVPCMTVLACQPSVTFFGSKPGCSRVVKANGLPRRRRMTIVAFGAVVTFMNVVNRVAAGTCSRCLCKNIPPVTIDTGNGIVRTAQRILGFCVVENCLRPCTFNVAILARLTKRTVVDIVFGVATAASNGGIAIRLIACVTITA